MPYLNEELSQAKRDKLQKSDFIFPNDRSWPIHDLKHGKIALTWSLWPQHQDVSTKVIKAVFNRYPELRFTPVGKKCAAKLKGKASKAPAKDRRERLAASMSLGTLGDDPLFAERIVAIKDMLSDADELPSYVHHDPRGIGVEEEGILSSLAETRDRLRYKNRRR